MSQSKISMEEYESVEELLTALKNKAAEAHSNKNTLLLSVYAKFIRLLTPELHKLRARLDREDLAEFSRRHKALRKADRAAAAAQPQSPDPTA